MGDAVIRIVASEHDAWVGVAAQEALEGIPRPGTETWSPPQPHPANGTWSFVLSDLAPSLPDDLERLPDDWFPPSEV